jgi:hypothetical protein
MREFSSARCGTTWGRRASANHKFQGGCGLDLSRAGRKRPLHFRKRFLKLFGTFRNQSPLEVNGGKMAQGLRCVRANHHGL